jgi:Fur family peroxide stress response transcriptional regulator
MADALSVLREHGIQATPQRIAVAEYVLDTDSHPSSEQVWAKVRRSFPTVSRATVYNTLNLLVEKGLLRAQVLRGGTIVFDCRVKPHHHFIDRKTGKIYDIPWDAVKVTGHRSLGDFEVEEHQVVMKGRRRKR